MCSKSMIIYQYMSLTFSKTHLYNFGYRLCLCPKLGFCIESIPCIQKRCINELHMSMFCIICLISFHWFFSPTTSLNWHDSFSVFPMNMFCPHVWFGCFIILEKPLFPLWQPQYLILRPVCIPDRNFIYFKI